MKDDALIYYQDIVGGRCKMIAESFTKFENKLSPQSNEQQLNWDMKASEFDCCFEELMSIGDALLKEKSHRLNDSYLHLKLS